MSVALRVAMARAGLALGMGGRELERLFEGTASAFGALVPERRTRGVDARLHEYARFTREHAEQALLHSGDGQKLEQRLYRAGHSLGTDYRRRMRVRSRSDAMGVARLVYAGIGIDFRASANGEVIIRRCRFASVYSPTVCGLISAMDRGLLAGLAGGGQLAFRRRLTEGADCCRAVFSGAST